MGDEIALGGLPPPQPIPYSIHSVSGHTTFYVPSNILVDNPADVNSRWTGAPHSSGGGSSSDSSSGGDKKTTVGPGPGPRWRKDIQYITLELERPCIVTAIGFGKYAKQHACNLSEFQVFGGMSPEKRCLQPLYHGGLKNDSVKEKFPLNVGTTEGQKSVKGTPTLLPCKYIRIDALAAHSTNYNVAIWHVWLEGVSDPVIVDRVVAQYEETRSRTTSHLILSHLRRSFLLPAFDSLRASLPLSVTTTFEHPLLTTLHTSLVLKGLFTGPSGGETVLENALQQGLFHEWGEGGGKGKSVARWEKLSDDPSLEAMDGGVDDRPSGRGGQTMARVGRKLLMYGGWDGGRELGDMWECDLPRTAGVGESVGPWRRVEQKGYGEEGRLPGPRSCHQFAVDESEGWVYLLGRYGEAGDVEEGRERRPTSPIRIPSPDSRARTNGGPRSPASAIENGASNGGAAMEVEEGLSVHPIGTPSRSTSRSRNPWANDFWRFKAVGPGHGQWELLCADVSAVGGPKSTSDHQMLIESASRTLFVFGGKHVEPGPNPNPDVVEGVYSGMFSYDIESQTWTSLFSDPTPTDPFRSERLLSRTGPAMLFDPSLPSLFILGGNRGDTYLSDLWSIHLAPVSTSDSPPPSNHLSPPPAPSVIVTDPPTAPSILLAPKNLTSDCSRDGGPPPMFIPRATIDVQSGEWTVFSGVATEGKSKVCPPGDIWTRSRAGVWEKAAVRGETPIPRSPASVVYDPLRKEHYMFGGNEMVGEEKTRLGDFWRVKIVKPVPEEALRKALFLVRKQRFTEMCQTQPALSALTYLQTTLSSVVDHTDEAEASAFRACMAALLAAPSSNNPDEDFSMDDDDDSDDEAPEAETAGREGGVGAKEEDKEVPLTPELFAQRQALFEDLLDFFPDGERQPREDLRDLAMPRRDGVIGGRTSLTRCRWGRHPPLHRRAARPSHDPFPQTLVRPQLPAFRPHQSRIDLQGHPRRPRLGRVSSSHAWEPGPAEDAQGGSQDQGARGEGSGSWVCRWSSRTTFRGVEPDQEVHRKNDQPQIPHLRDQLPPAALLALALPKSLSSLRLWTFAIDSLPTLLHFTSLSHLSITASDLPPLHNRLRPTYSPLPRPHSLGTIASARRRGLAPNAFATVEETVSALVESLAKLLLGSKDT